MYLLFFVICPWELKPMIIYWRWSQWSMVESGAPICASAHACEFVCALIPLLNVGELWEWCPWFVICQVRMYVLPVSAVVFVGMQQANHSIVGHLSSVIACREPPHFSGWKINGLLFVSLSIFPSCFNVRVLSYILFLFTWFTWAFTHKRRNGWRFQELPSLMQCLLGHFEYEKNHINLSEHNLWL